MRPTPPLLRKPDNGEAPFIDEGRLLRAIAAYLSPEECEHITDVLEYAHTLQVTYASQRDGAPEAAPRPHTRWDFKYVIAVAQLLADAVHVDAVSLGAVLLYQPVELGVVTPDDIRAALHGPFGDETAQLIESIERFDALQRPAAARRAARRDPSAGGEDTARERRRERQRRQEAEAVRKMFVGMAEDPRVVVFKIADQLLTMRAAREAADLLRERAGEVSSLSSTVADRPGEDSVLKGAANEAEPPATGQDNSRPLRVLKGAANVGERPAEPSADPQWTLDECLAAARETRTLYAPLAGRLGMERLEAELDDLAFAVLEPNEYRWLSEAVAEEKHQRSSYVSRVCEILREEMAKIGLRAEVSGRVKHLYSTYRKVQSRGIRDVSQLYDIVAFRITVDTVADCYLALGHVHHLWRPKDGRIKDFIANPKPNGYQALHTTVFCLDERLAEIQICTHAMHQVAKYGVAMHWHYKKEGDTASALAPELQAWVKQVMEWQQERVLTPLAPLSSAEARGEPTDGDAALLPAELIYVFTPAGDPKELPAGSTPLDFAYRIHSGIGDHCAGARVTTEDGRLVTKMVPLDYELRNGDTVEIITHKGAHPTRDWLHFAHTKAARNHIGRYLKAHERHIDQQIGRDRLDRELKTQGVRTGMEMLHEDDLLWVARELDLRDVESLLVALGIEKLKATGVIGKLRERRDDLFPPPRSPLEAHEAPAPTVEPETQGGVDVAGVAGLYTRLASCCNPAPGDLVRGFITRGRGVVVHRADCPSLAAMLEREPERAVPVELSTLEGHQTYHVPIVVQATDRAGLLADVTGVISRLKINMVKVTTVTNEGRHSATITAILEVERADQLETVMRQVSGVKSVLSVGRKEHPRPKGLGESGVGHRRRK